LSTGSPPVACILPARERIVGWYHTGPRLREADIDINNLMARYCDNPVLVICEVQVRASWVRLGVQGYAAAHC
jgi:proteasome lid subunit RPN8/RPN11